LKGSILIQDRGNAVLASIASIFLTTLLTLTTMGLSLSAFQVLVIRDAAITAASKTALANSPNQERYLMKLLDDSLPSLASYEIKSFGNQNFVGLTINARVPGAGMLPGGERYEVSVAATKENLL
jgi:hypothetical protein